MKKIVKLIFVLCVIAIISIVQLPVVAIATTTTNIIQNVKQKKNEEKNEYIDGEVVIMYRKSDYATKLKSSSTFSNLKIKDTVEFEDVDIDTSIDNNVSTKGSKERKSINKVQNNSKEDIVVSLVFWLT